MSLRLMQDLGCVVREGRQVSGCGMGDVASLSTGFRMWDSRCMMLDGKCVVLGREGRFQVSGWGMGDARFWGILVRLGCFA